jgi:hypothetical protein
MVGFRELSDEEKEEKALCDRCRKNPGKFATTIRDNFNEKELAKVETLCDVCLADTATDLLELVTEKIINRL